MKSSLRPVLAALTLGLAFFPMTAIAQGVGPSAEHMTARLDAAVALTPDQATQAMEIFQNETDALNAFTPQAPRHFALPHGRRGFICRFIRRQ